MRLTFCLIGAVLSWLFQTAHARTIWIDTDVSIGAPFREVDDAFALLLAFHCPELKIAGISTTYGNASLNVTTGVGRNLVNRFGADAGLQISDVNAGANNRNDLGRATPASEALASALRQDRHLTYVALGPLTDLASFLKLHPERARHIDRIIFVGGKSPGLSLGFGRNKSFRIHDANVVKDPAAVQVVLESKIPITLAPIETSSDLSIDAADFQELRRSGGAGEYLAGKSKTWLWFWTHLVHEKGGPIFDALAICMLRPDLVVIQKRYAALDSSGNLIAAADFGHGTRPVEFATTLKPTAKPFVLQKLGAARP